MQNLLYQRSATEAYFSHSFTIPVRLEPSHTVSGRHNVYPRLGASDPFSVLIESKRNVGGIKLFIADPLPRTMRATLPLLPIILG
jgi:hypothetical protein